MERIKDLEGEQRHPVVLRAPGVETLRRRLRRDRMMPLVRIAKPLLAYAPGAESALRVPHARADAHMVATAAMKMADVLQKHAKLMRSAGYSKDFRGSSDTRLARSRWL